jgi:hypothetical protein
MRSATSSAKRIRQLATGKIDAAHDLVGDGSRIIVNICSISCRSSRNRFAYRDYSC